MFTDFCVICNEIVKDRYKVSVTDTMIKNYISGFICRACYINFLKSHNHEGRFGIQKFKAWLKGTKKDMFRM